MNEGELATKTVEIGPMTQEAAQTSARELIARLDGIIQTDTEKFIADHEQLMALAPRSTGEADMQSRRAEQLVRAFEERLHPVRREREALLNALAPLSFYRTGLMVVVAKKHGKNE